MPAPEPPWREVLRRCANGELSPAVASLRLLMAFGKLESIRSVLEQAEQDPAAKGAVAAIGEFLHGNAEGSAAVLRFLEREQIENQNTAPDELERCRRLFDSLVADSPEASVALYSFGNGDLLDAATGEVVGLLGRLGLLEEDREVLEIGCGIGRFQRALAPRVTAITGIDIAPAMIATARRRCAGLPNVHLTMTSGRDLSAFASNSFDLVLAVDSMPYLYWVGPDLVATHFCEVARVLRAGGDFLVLNVSYRGDLGRDREDVGRFAGEAGLEVVRNGSADLRLWDASTFHLRKPQPAGRAQPARRIMRP
jgi:SAM-dependent methyltransferase